MGNTPNPNIVSLDQIEQNPPNMIQRAPITSVDGGPVPPAVEDRYQGGVLSQIGLQTDIAASQLPGSSPKIRLMPSLPAGNAQINSVIKSTGGSSFGTGLILENNGALNPNQGILNLTSDGVGIVAYPDGRVILSAESAVAPYLFDDFFNAPNASAPFGGATSIIGTLGWYLYNTGANNPQSYGGTFANLGQFAWSNSGSTKQYAGLVINANTGSGVMAPNGMAMLENPGWSATWTFKMDYGTSSGGGVVSAFNPLKKSFYLGLAGTPVITTVASSAVSCRPDIFMGLRYDTSATPGSLVLSSVASTTGVYTGTITGGGSNAYVGYTFTVTGFTNAANNGTFICKASSGTTLTLNNTASVAESHTAAASSTGVGDGFYTFEVVENASYLTAFRNNVQGQVSVTTLAPAADGWHTFTIECDAVGQLTMTLDDLPSVTFTVPQFTWKSSGNQLASPNGMANVNYSVASQPVFPATLPTNPYPPLGQGSIITITGATGGQSGLNGTWTIDHIDNTAPDFQWFSGLSGITAAGATLTCVAYPSLIPMMNFGNDDSASPTADNMRFYIDKFVLEQA